MGDFSVSMSGGIHLTRDNLASVRYAEGLNSTTSSVIHQRTDRHEIVGEKSADFQRDSYTWPAERSTLCHTNRALQKQRASAHPGDGRPQPPPRVRGCGKRQKAVVGLSASWWPPSLFSASSQGWERKRSASFSAVFALRLMLGVRLAPCEAVMQVLEQAILETAAAWEYDGIAHGETK
jgi:hypothetical protein